MTTKVETLRASAAQTPGTATGIAGAGLIKFDKPWRELVVQVNVTAAATDVGDTLDVYIDTSYDGGSTWLNIMHFTQVLGNGGAKRYIMACKGAPVASSNAVLASSDQSAGNALQFPLGDRIRYRGVVANAGTEDASFTYTVTAFLKE